MLMTRLAAESSWLGESGAADAFIGSRLSATGIVARLAAT
jgi:hypothetical protein